ncbi:MAG: ribbon-helix-helix domain-containing protein [Caldilineaceae bacterium]
MIVTEKVTLTLPIELMARVRDLAPARRQSQFIAEAIRAYIAEQERQALRARLMAGYQANAGVDVAVAADWEAVDEESWNTLAAPQVVGA